jgi:hypothetical protein
VSVAEAIPLVLETVAIAMGCVMEMLLCTVVTVVAYRLVVNTFHAPPDGGS